MGNMSIKRICDTCKNAMIRRFIYIYEDEFHSDETVIDCSEVPQRPILDGQIIVECNHYEKSE